MYVMEPIAKMQPYSMLEIHQSTLPTNKHSLGYNVLLHKGLQPRLVPRDTKVHCHRAPDSFGQLSAIHYGACPQEIESSL